MTKHTQAPWTFGEFQSNGLINQTPINPIIGVAYGCKKESMANARLMAAAPELLEVLERARYGLSNFLTQKEKLILVNDIENTIAKAKGE